MGYRIYKRNPSPARHHRDPPQYHVFPHQRNDGNDFKFSRLSEQAEHPEFFEESKSANDSNNQQNDQYVQKPERQPSLALRSPRVDQRWRNSLNHSNQSNLPFPQPFEDYPPSAYGLQQFEDRRPSAPLVQTFEDSRPSAPPSQTFEDCCPSAPPLQQLQQCSPNAPPVALMATPRESGLDHNFGWPQMDVEILKLKVPMCCEACEDRVAVAISKMKGVQHVECEYRRKKVTVTGTATASDILKACKKIFKRSEPWVDRYY